MTETVHVPDDPSDMDLPFWGKVRLKARAPWVPAVFWSDQAVADDGTPLGDVRYWAWISGATWRVLDPLECPYWPWWPIEPSEWHELHREMESRRNAQEH